MVWHDDFGSGGGNMDGFPIPIWQQGIDMSVNRGSTSLRNSPDVAMVANRLFIIFNGKDTGARGTSAASPLWAGLIALANQRTTEMKLNNVGFINPAVAAIGKSFAYLNCFHDVTVGNNLTIHNMQPDNQNEYYAVPGFDLCTGWGSPKGNSLIDTLVFTAQPPAKATLNYVGTGSCDPGPVAGESARFSVQVAGGVPPLTYSWSSANCTITSGNTPGSASVQVQVPQVNSSGTLSVSVADVESRSVSTSITVAGVNPSLAQLERTFCELVRQLDRFRRPLYINPGDPGPVDFRLDSYTPVEVENIQELGGRIATLGSSTHTNSTANH